jgi:class 3 adenylate cyclase
VGADRRRGDDLIGHDVNLASRITDLAAAGEVLVSEAARYRDDVPADVVFEALGPVFVKGIDEPLRLFRASRTTGSS